MIQKNIAQGTMNRIELEKEVVVLRLQHEDEFSIEVTQEVESKYLQFHFCLKGVVHFVFNDGNYQLPLRADRALLLYNPQRNLPIRAVLNGETWLISLLISIKKFHTLFSPEAAHISFLDQENKDKKYYTETPIAPMQAVVLNQMLHKQVHPTMELLYTKAKVYELMSLYFNKDEETDLEQCPFLVDEDSVRRIRNAKSIIIARMAEPPSLPALAQEIGLSLKKLKEGFKQLYGTSVYGFLLDYKMEMARNLLTTGQHNVNEIGLKLGYSSASHFIEAFKKKYGTTPKKYRMSLSSPNQ